MAKQDNAPPARPLSQRLRGLGVALRDFASHVHRAFQDDRGAQVAAALTYHTLFSLLPTVALALVVLKTFVGPAEQAAFKDVIVDFVARWMSDGADAAAQSAGEVMSRAARYDAVLAQLDENVKRLLDDLQSIDFQGIGVVGVLLFIYGATALLATVERSFNQIYEAPSGRPLYVRIPLYYTTITLAPMVIVAGQLLQARLLSGIGTFGWTRWLTPPLAAALPVLSTWLVFTLMYRLIPNTRVDLRAAAIGAALASVVWVAVVEGFAIYVGNYAAASLYGALALFPLALLFVWVAWTIVVYGLEIARTLQLRPWRDPDVAYGSEPRRPASLDPRWALMLAMAVAARFRRGEPGTVSELAEELGLADAMVAQLLDVLEAAGVVCRIEGAADAAPRYLLARAADGIDLNELLDRAEQRSFGEGRHSPAGAGVLLAHLQAVRREALAGRTLADAVAEAAESAPAATRSGTGGGALGTRPAPAREGATDVRPARSASAGEREARGASPKA